MGLDTSHDCWHGAYSAFSRWREEIAKIAGYAVWPVKFEDGVVRDTIMIDWGHLPENSLFGEWSETPSDPLLVLIAHSDCEGVIHPEQAGPLANRLEELLPEIEKIGESFGHIAARGGWRVVTEAFINGLRSAVKDNETVDFH